MTASKNKYQWKFNRETLRFETDLEKKIHKLLSKVNLGTTLELTIEGEEEAFIKAVKKSLFYNNTDYRIRIAETREKVILHFDY